MLRRPQRRVEFRRRGGRGDGGSASVLYDTVSCIEHGWRSRADGARQQWCRCKRDVRLLRVPDAIELGPLALDDASYAASCTTGALSLACARPIGHHARPGASSRQQRILTRIHDAPCLLLPRARHRRVGLGRLALPQPIALPATRRCGERRYRKHVHHDVDGRQPVGGLHRRGPDNDLLRRAVLLRGGGVLRGPARVAAGPHHADERRLQRIRRRRRGHERRRASSWRRAWHWSARAYSHPRRFCVDVRGTSDRPPVRLVSAAICASHRPFLRQRCCERQCTRGCLGGGGGLLLRHRPLQRAAARSLGRGCCLDTYARERNAQRHAERGAGTARPDTQPFLLVLGRMVYASWHGHPRRPEQRQWLLDLCSCASDGAEPRAHRGGRRRAGPGCMRDHGGDHLRLVRLPRPCVALLRQRARRVQHREAALARQHQSQGRRVASGRERS